MKRPHAAALGFLLLVIPVSHVNGQMGTPFRVPEAGINEDPHTGEKYKAAVKINILQILFSEVQFSFELFSKNNTSHNLQAGIIFPLPDRSFLEQFFESSGQNSTASDKGLISYRSSPFNNSGLSLRYELRKYISNYYYGPQVMYKNCHYRESTFPVLQNNSTIYRTESKNSDLAGLGMVFGLQKYFRRQVTDIYGVIGVRSRLMSVEISGIRHPSGTEQVISPPIREKDFSVYPFINMGFRIGIIL